MGDTLNTSHLYAVKLKPSTADRMNIPTKANGHTLDIKTANQMLPAKANGKQLKLTTTKSELSQETIRETFSHFGTVERIILPAKPGKHARHAFISE